MKVIISPHLDDAVFSCAGELSGATVVTICAGVPPEDTPPSDFDRRAGFRSAREAMRARREEDHDAAAVLGFTPRHMDQLDHAYGGGDLVGAVGSALAGLDAGADVYGPLGLRHPDHKLIAAAFRTIARTRHLSAWVYEDQPYAYVWPEDLEGAIAHVDTIAFTRPSPPDKREAVDAYRSQIGPQTHMAAIMAPERIHPL